MDRACAEARRLVGAAFREARLAAGVTQREVHERTGIDIASLSRIENGRGNPSLDTLAKMARAIGRALPDLFAPRS
ncbi:MAG: helix-turn-helix transcriptional regulator [Acetobacteraceae bacterium]|nr:helix-turn-helix transcriptional regulator [Acetobacteraceae bacterium]